MSVSIVAGVDKTKAFEELEEMCVDLQTLFKLLPEADKPFACAVTSKIVDRVVGWNSEGGDIG